MFKVIVLVIIIWVVGSAIYGFASGKIDYRPFKKEIELHPVGTIMVVLAILAILYFIFRK